jgi:hypothetical protein
MTRVMLDTNVFDEILKHTDSWHKLPKDIKYFATKIQYQQIEAISEVDKRTALKRIFETVVDEIIPSIDQEWVSFENSNFSNTRFISSDEEKELNKLSNITETLSHIADALIHLTARYGVESEIIIVTNDKGTPFKRARKVNYNIMTFDEFLTKFSPSKSSSRDENV